MENKMLEQIKNKFEQMDSNEENRIKKNEIKENEKENKRLERVKKGTQKVYYEIWEQILKNVKKPCFNIGIYITFDGDKTLYVTKIKVDKNIKKITRTPVNKDYLEYLLNNDGLSLNKTIKGDILIDEWNIKEELYVVPVVKFQLKTIIDKKTKNKELLKK